MRKALALAAALLAAHLLAGAASAQCIGIIPPPRAPDMYNTPGLYNTTCFGMMYGPTYCLRPPFAPFQGAIGAIQGYPCAQPPQTGPAGFGSHLYARSPRDFYMYDTDPRSSPYTYGYTSPYDRVDRAPPAGPLAP